MPNFLRQTSCARLSSESFRLAMAWATASPDKPLAAAQAWQDWYASTPDTPCIAICSTSQGDETCKGCGRSFEEVQMWIELSPGEKRAIWRRITVDGTSWRFNRYAERAAEERHWAKAAAEAQVPLDLKP